MEVIWHSAAPRALPHPYISLRFLLDNIYHHSFIMIKMKYSSPIYLDKKYATLREADVNKYIM